MPVYSDTAFDMIMGLNAGVGAVGVAWGYHPVEELKAAGAHAIIGEFSALGSVLDRLLLERECTL